MKANFENPDFAFPVTVNTDARKILAESKSPADGQSRLQALLQIVRATTDIGGDQVYDLPKFVDSVLTLEPCADIRGLMQLLEARVYHNIYSRARYKYNRIPKVEPRPESIAEWSGEDFTDKIKSLVQEASLNLSAWYSAPLSDYSKVITADSTYSEVFPYLRDFAWLQIKDLIPDEEESVIEKAALLSDYGSAEWVYWTLGASLYTDMESEQIETVLSQAGTASAKAMCYVALLNAGGNETYSDRNDKSLVEKKVIIYKAVKDFLDSKPVTPLASELKKIWKGYLVPTLEIKFREVSAPGVPVNFNIEHTFTSRVGIQVYLDESGKGKVIYEDNAATDSLSSGITTISHTFNLPGKYYVFSTINKSKQERRRRGEMIFVTPVMLTLATHKDQAVWLVTDTRTGRPIEGITVKTNGFKGVSDDLGLVPFDVKKSGSTPVVVTLKDGTDLEFPEEVYLPSYRSVDPKHSYNASVFFGRPLYRPGDTLDMSVVIADRYRDESSPLAETELIAKLYNASGSEVAADTITTDSYGRAHTSFSIPKDVMAGRFRVDLMLKSSLSRIGSGAVMVSEFKRPAFEITDVKARCTDSAIVVSGCCERYTGAAVPNANVSLSIDDHEDLTGGTDDQGKFEIVIPISSLTPDRYYYSELTVTAPSGDIATSTLSFFSRIQPKLEMDWVDYYDASSPITLKVKATDGAGNQHFPMVKWQLMLDDTVKASGSAPLGVNGLEVDWSRIPAGKYKLELSAEGCESLNNVSTVIYNTRRNLMPDDVSLIIPSTSYTADTHGTAEVKVGVPRPSQIYVFSIDDEGKMEVKHLAASRGFNSLKLSPKGYNQCSYLIMSVCGTDISRKTITVSAPDTTPKTWLKGEAWRDNIVPGTNQQWRIRFESDNNRGLSGAMIATLYNRSLEAYVCDRWPSMMNFFKIIRSSITPSVSTLADGSCYLENRVDVEYSSLSIGVPYFRYLQNYIDAYPSSRRFYRYSSRNSAYALDGEPMLMEKAYAAAPPVSEMMNDEAEITSGTGEYESDIESPIDGTDSVNTHSFRNADVFQIFWRPEIVIGSDGIAEIEFEMPDAIGSWQFNATAWNQAGMTANLSAVLESSKPVTIEGNAPRFVRAGDEVEIPATVINRTSESVEAEVMLEIFEVASGKVLDSFNTVLTINAEGQQMVSIKVNVSGEQSLIGFRACVTAKEFTDGEQSLIPVLEAAVRAYDSKIFYMDGAENSMTLNVPADRSGNGSAALQFCTNPMWDVIKALPALYDFEPKTATLAVNSLFGALIARGISQRHPEVVNVVHQWTSNPSDSALVSPLLKNDDLKMITLGSTPFVGSAEYMTRQMQRLAVALDQEQASSASEIAIRVLENLQMPDGGFSWIEWNPKSSLFITQYVIQLIGRLNMLGFHDERTNAITDRAFVYIDDHIDELGDLQYAYLYSLFPDRKPTEEGRKAISRGVTKIVKDWRKDSPVFKALDAMILKANGQSSVAANIVRSIGQFAVNSPTVGLEIPKVTLVDSYAQILEAVAKIDPKSKMIDGLRKWLILKTQTTDDLGAWNPTELIAALLATGTDWTSLTDANVQLKIDGRSVQPSKIELATGAFTMRLPSSSEPRTISISRKSGLTMPSYGSLLSIADVSLDSVSASDCGELKIQKRLLVQNGNAWVDAYAFEPGQRIKVQLMLTATRELEYVSVSDARPAGFEPVNQMPGLADSSSLWAYRTNDIAATNFFLGYLPRGVHYIEYEVIAGHPGEFISGVAAVQSQYAPEFTARSGARRVTVVRKNR